MSKTRSPIAALDQVTRRRGAALLLDVLRSEGVRYIFGNPGTTELPLIDALIDAPQHQLHLGSAGGERGGHG